MNNTKIKNNWSYEQAFKLYSKPFNDLIFEAQSIHRKFFALSLQQFYPVGPYLVHTSICSRVQTPPDAWPHLQQGL